MSDGERIGVGCFGDAPQATEYARDVVNHLGAHSDGSWPLFEGRFLRPDTIVSVDVVAEQTEQWLGSRLRTRWAANLG